MNTQNYPPPTIVNDYILGIQYGDFDDDIITSSDCGNGLIRKNCKLNGPNCWLASNSDKNGFIQVNLRNGFIINAISIQGRSGNSEWVTKFRVLWSPDGKEYINLCELKGNVDDSTVEKKYLPEPIFCKGIRIQPLECNNYRSMRFELHYLLPKSNKYNI